MSCLLEIFDHVFLKFRLHVNFLFSFVQVNSWYVGFLLICLIFQKIGVKLYFRSYCVFKFISGACTGFALLDLATLGENVACRRDWFDFVSYLEVLHSVRRSQSSVIGLAFVRIC